MVDEARIRNSGTRLKIFAGLVAMVFAVTLAVVIGNRLSEEALAVLAGAVCGVGAAIPTSLLVVAVSRRRDEERNVMRREISASIPYAQHQPTVPPVVLVSPPGMQQRVAGWNALPPSMTTPIRRSFTVVGGASEPGGESYERYS